MIIISIKGSSRHAEKKLKGADDDDEGCQTGVARTRSRAGAEQEQARSIARAGQKHEQGKNRVGTGQEQS